MIPLRDDIPSRRTPWINYLVIAICAAAFFAQQSSDDESQQIVESYAFVPLRLSDPSVTPVLQQQVAVQTSRGPQLVVVDQELGPAAIPAWMTLITCMFLHGGWMHFLGNMWFLYIFGDNVEDRLGHVGYAMLYVLTGIAAGVAHYASDPSSPVPTVGASGAIAGVMGAYALFYPHAKVLAVLPIIIFLQTFVLPARIFLGIWFAFQIFNGLGSIGGGMTGGVAWWAHAGGFLAGAVCALVFKNAHLDYEPVTERRF